MLLFDSFGTGVNRHVHSASYPFLSSSLTLRRNIGSNRAALVRRKFSANLKGLHLDTSPYVFRGISVLTFTNPRNVLT